MNETTQLQQILQGALGWHRARTRLAASFILALMRVRTVNFPSLALALNPFVKPESNERRLQRFFASHHIDLDAFAKVLFSLAPKQESLVITLDRTHWQVGGVDLNVLMFGIAHQGVAFPLLWQLLGKTGCSNTAERKALLDRLLRVVPSKSIKVVVADREFIGKGWFATLKERGIPFVIRVRKNALLTSRGCTRPAGEWISSLPLGVVQCRVRRVRIYGHKLFVTSLKRADQDVIVVSERKWQDALALYGQRWSIETLFSNLKSRGFNLEATRVRSDVRIERLLALLALAFAWAYRVGLYLTGSNSIRLKRHGRKQKSVFRLGLDHVRRILLNLPYQSEEFSRCLRAIQFI